VGESEHGGSPFDPDKAFRAMQVHVQLLRDEHGNAEALAAYNAGEGISLLATVTLTRILQQSGSLPRLRLPGRALFRYRQWGSNLFGDALDALNLSSGYKRRSGCLREKDIVDLIQAWRRYPRRRYCVPGRIVVLVRPSTLKRGHWRRFQGCRSGEKRASPAEEAVTDASEG